MDGDARLLSDLCSEVRGCALKLKTPNRGEWRARSVTHRDKYSLIDAVEQPC